MTIAWEPQPTGWPPPGDPVDGVPELPEPATAAYRMPGFVAAYVAVLPAMVLLSAGRLVMSARVPASRLLNPGTAAVAALMAVVLLALCLPSRRRLMVAGGPGWVARRFAAGSRFRVVRFADLTAFSVRTVATRGGRRTFVVLVGADGRCTGLSVPAASACGPALVGALRATGVREVPSRETRRGTVRQAVAIAAVLLAIGLLPVGYLLVGPFRLMPARVAGWFSSSGCRAALAAERSGPGQVAVFWNGQEDVDGSTWRLSGDYPMTLDRYAAGSNDPPDRIAHLRSDGAVSADQLAYVGPAGEVLVVDSVVFATPSGAVSYERHVNRATCERFAGSAGPAPTEVRWHSGRTYGLARWVSGHTMYDVSPALTTPRATGAEADGLAAAFLGAPRSATAAGP